MTTTEGSREGVTVTSWDGPEQPTEQALRAWYAREGLSPYRWSNGPEYRYGTHRHPYHKVLYVVDGSIRFVLHPGGPVDLNPGDRLDLPPGTDHSAVVGSRGVVCLEAARH
jgi:mannose-6-phosphate isomerase-like protein (cupin superfamily)